MKQPASWRANFTELSPLFGDLQRVIKQKNWTAWPDCADLNQLWKQEHKTRSNFPIRFVPQSSLSDQTAYYEEHIYTTGQVPTRENNWHDFFNALVWFWFPKLKAAINALHVDEIEHQIDKKNRSRKRDALTLFDESGVIFVCDDTQMTEALKEHDWIKLFWQKRNDWWLRTAVFIFGHGLYEKSLSPYIGLTGNALIYPVDKCFFKQDRQSQIALLDQNISDAMLNQNLLEVPSHLTPLPVLGVPGWWSDNNSKDFYMNTHYFRPKRQ